MPDPTDEVRELAMPDPEKAWGSCQAAAIKTLMGLGYTWAGGELWKPPLGLSPFERWQPIETAPKDGTHVLLANQAGASEGGWLSDIDHGADWEGQIGMAGWWRADGTDWPNTHWQPLPAAPSASPAEAPAAQPVAPAGQAAAGVQGDVPGLAEHIDEAEAALRTAHSIMVALDKIERRIGPIGSHARGCTHKITNALRHLEALRAALPATGAAPAVERGVTIERSVAQEIRETLSTYVTTYNDCWERGMDILEPMGDKALALLDAALSTAGKEQA